MLEEFRTEPFADFSKPEPHAAMEAALARVAAAAGEEVPVVVNGRRITTGRILENTNPADRSQVLSRHPLAAGAIGEEAVKAALAAERSWREVPYLERAAVLLRAARRMRERRHDFNATMVLEIGKTWAEADVETAESI